jgi:hypothetical protein
LIAGGSGSSGFSALWLPPSAFQFSNRTGSASDESFPDFNPAPIAQAARQGCHKFETKKVLMIR